MFCSKLKCELHLNSFAKIYFYKWKFVSNYCLLIKKNVPVKSVILQ